MQGYSTQEVARLLDLPVHRIRSFARAGFVTPARGSNNRYLFTFQDLVLLRTAAELSRARVPARRINSVLTRLKAQLPVGRSLSELRIHAAGDNIVVSESGEPPWNPESGQFQMEFDVAELAARVAPLARGVSQRAHASTAERTAAEWFGLAVELEAVAPEEARAAYQRALVLDDALVDARVNLGRLLQEAGLLAEAEVEYRRALSTGEHALAAYNLGTVLEDAGRATDAIQAYARALAADAELAEAHYNLARLYEARGDQRAAIRHFNGYRELVRLRER
ncbi:MAG TPA: tetratricopeptide repeat protein [Longimicrobiales bacterium]|nr:tetratricopeptide repeat protein [Longimicrobiales bacterium]